MCVTAAMRAPEHRAWTAALLAGAGGLKRRGVFPDFLSHRRAISSSTSRAAPARIHRSNIEVSRTRRHPHERRAGVGFERVQSSHGSPAPFCAQVPGRSDAEPPGAERGGDVSAAASGLPASPFLWRSGNRAGCDGAGRLGADGGERSARTCRRAWPYARAAVDFAERASRARARAVASRQPFGAAAAANRTA